MSDKAQHESSASPKHLDSRLRSVDENRWLALRYAREDVRDRLVPLLLMQSELNRALRSAEPMLGQIRVQWWRDVIEGVLDGRKPPRQEVAIGVERSIFDRRDMALYLMDMLEAYDRRLSGDYEDDPLLMVGGLSSRMAAQMINPDAAECNDEAVRTCGEIYAVARYAPDTLDTDKLQEARRMFRQLPIELYPSVAHVAIAPLYLKNKRPHSLQRRWRIFRAVLRGWF